jgi:hypothetical protein
MSKSKLITLTIFTYVLLLPVFLSAGTFKLPDTGQTKCYRGVDPYDEIPCAGTGQDGAYVQNPLSYTDNGNGTVTDNNTGLVWQQQDDGPGYNWYVASGIYDATQNPESMDVCGSLDLGGATDWRLPTKKELMSIVDYAIPFPGPTNNTAYFQNRRGSNDWSSTTVAGDPDSAMHVNFEIGGVYSDYKFYGLSVRCVRGGQSPSSPLIDNGNGTVTDSRTSLIWQQGETELMSWGAALSYCEGLNLGGSTAWRLPNIKELESLTDDTQSNPSIDTSMFPNTYASGYWSSTTNAYYSDNTWFVGFSNGGVWIYPKNNEYTTLNIRCVRGGQVEPPPPTYGNLEISPSSHDFGEVAVELCSAPQQFTLSNTGNGDLTISEIALSDNENFELSINAFQCENTIYPGGSCAFDVYFCPKTSGDLSTNLTITSDDPDSPLYDVPLTGLAQCNPFSNVYFIGDYAGLYEGIIDNKSVNDDCCTLVEIDIQAATLIDICIPGFPCIKKGVEFWTSIEEIDFDSSVASYKSSTADVTGGLLADWKLIPPGMHASYEVNFCKPGTVTFELGFSEKAIGITIADVMTSIIPVVGDIPYSTIIEFYDDLSDIPLVSSAINHESSAMNAALSGNKRLALSETVKARIDLLKLIFNKKQMNQLLQAYVALVENLKLDITDNELQKLILKKWGATIPIKVFKVFSDAIVLVIQTKGGTAGPIQIKLVAN